MLTQLSTVKTRLAVVVTDYDDLLTNAIKAVSARFDKETNRTLAAPGIEEACQKPTKALASNHGSRRIHNHLQDPEIDAFPLPISPANSIPTLYAKAGY